MGETNDGEVNVVSVEGAPAPPTFTTRVVDPGEPKPKLKRRWTEEEAAKLEQKFERQKRALQRFVLVTLEEGERQDGLTAPQVSVLREALEVLGWLPTDLKV